MDERERDKFYSPPVPPDDDDEELELEPLDPAIVSAEQQHAKHFAEQVRTSIDIDDVYREAERSRGAEIAENWVRNFKYRFQISHVLLATAVLAILVAASTLSYLIPMVTIVIIGSIVSLYFYLSWEDRKQQAAADARREELFAKRREELLANRDRAGGIEPPQPVETPTPAVKPISSAADMWNEPPPPEPIRIHFSMRSLIIAMTVAAVSFGMIRVLGGPGPTATILGLIAVAGLLVHAIGFEPPQSVILGWWFILILYVVLSIAGAL